MHSEQKRKLKIQQQQRENTNEIKIIITNNDSEVKNFLASGKSYSQLDRDRLSTFFEAIDSTRARSVLASRRIKEGSRKAREHVGNMDNYSFDRDRKLPRVPRVVWRYLALKFHVRIKKWSHSPKRWSFYRHLLVKMVWTQTSLTNVKGLVV